MGYHQHLGSIAFVRSGLVLDDVLLRKDRSSRACGHYLEAFPLLEPECARLLSNNVSHYEIAIAIWYEYLHFIKDLRASPSLLHQHYI